MDTQLTFFLTLSFYLTYLAMSRLIIWREWKGSNRLEVWLLGGAGIAWAAALLTKFSGLLFLSVLATLPLYFLGARKKCCSWGEWWLKTLIPIGIVAGVGLVGLWSLKIAPSFSQLFSRGGDFLYSLDELGERPGEIISSNVVIMFEVLGKYMTGWWLVVIIGWAAIVWRGKREPIWLLLSGLAFAAGMLVLGKVIYPRYYLPVLPFLVVSGCVAGANLRGWSRFWKMVLVGVPLILGSRFIVLSWTKPAALPLTDSDYSQHFKEWSAGVGVKETVALIKELSENERLLVLSEGHIGTLPDGLQVYLFNDEARNRIQIEGVGQPIKQDNLEEAKIKALIAEYEQVVLVVNSYRLEINDLDEDNLLLEVARAEPDFPSLQVWRIK
jgi:hypothetical protein